MQISCQHNLAHLKSCQILSSEHSAPPSVALITAGGESSSSFHWMPFVYWDTPEIIAFNLILSNIKENHWNCQSNVGCWNESFHVLRCHRNHLSYLYHDNSFLLRVSFLSVVLLQTLIIIQLLMICLSKKSQDCSEDESLGGKSSS